MACKNCGTELPPRAIHCFECGVAQVPVRSLEARERGQEDPIGATLRSPIDAVSLVSSRPPPAVVVDFVTPRLPKSRLRLWAVAGAGLCLVITGLLVWRFVGI